MKNRIRKTKKTIDKELRGLRYERDADGRIVVNMTVEDDEHFLSAFSESNTPVIDSEVAEFIENTTKALPPKEALTLRIRSTCIDENEKVLYPKAIREYYTRAYVAGERELKRNHVIVLLLMLAGVGVLAAAILFDRVIGNAIWAEVIDIVAWVLLWEAVDIGVFETRSLRMRRLRCLSYLDMKIEYVSED